MRPIAVLITLLVANVSNAQLDGQAVSKRYQPFQGEWRLVSMENPESKRDEIPEIVVKVTGEQFELTGKGITSKAPGRLEFRIPETKEDNPYRDLKKRGAESIDDIVDVENQILVFWFVGIYRLKDDRLELAVKYCGQGLEGIHFRNFRPPSSFDQKPTGGETRFILERKKN
jgi:hypothetical protein